jgi:hypothetical protein
MLLLPFDKSEMQKACSDGDNTSLKLPIQDRVGIRIGIGQEKCVLSSGYSRSEEV